MDKVIKNGRRAIQRILDASQSELDDRRFLLDCLRQFGIRYQDWFPLAAFSDFTNPTEFGPIQVPTEFIDYLILAGRFRPRTVIEVGVYTGGVATFSAAYLLRKNPNLEYTVVDIHNFYQDLDYYSSILPIRAAIPASSQDFYGQAFDLAFLDADHRYDCVKQDWLNIGRFAGVTALHDIRDRDTGGTHRFWLELKAAMRLDATMLEIAHVPEKEGDWMGIGMVFRTPFSTTP